MPSLQSAARRGESHFQTDQGSDIYGTIFANTESVVPSYDFNTPRNFFRTHAATFLTAGSIVLDPFGRRFLLTLHDAAVYSDQQLYKIFRCYNLHTSHVWTRTTTVTDTLTGLQKGSGVQNLGIIWVCDEMINKEEIDLTLRVKESARRIMTNAALQLNDRLDDRIVKRVEPSLGVTIAEIQ